MSDDLGREFAKYAAEASEWAMLTLPLNMMTVSEVTYNGEPIAFCQIEGRSDR